MIEIRRAGKNDGNGIARVLKASYNMDSLEEGLKAFENECAKQYMFVVALIDGKIVGLTSYQIHGLPKHGLTELDRIAVLPEARNQGIGKKLFSYTVREAEDFYRKHNSRLRKIYLLTHSSNRNAQNFYEKLGLKKEAVLPDHFYKGEPEVVMSKFLFEKHQKK